MGLDPDGRRAEGRVSNKEGPDMDDQSGQAVTEIVCISQNYDLKAEFEAGFARSEPELRLCRPDEVRDPGAIRYCLSHDPAPGAFEAYPNLAMVCSWGAGVDKFVGAVTLPEGVILNRMTDPAQADMMAAFATYYVTGWHRKMFDYPAQQAARRWHEIDWTPNAEVPVAVLGFGRMGSAIVRALGGLGYPVRVWAGRARVEDGISVEAGKPALLDMAAGARVLINVLPLTEATEGILAEPLFNAMREDALLVQLARGGHLVEDDLLAALDRGRPAMAALDVFDAEPLPQDHPFWGHDRVFLTPHVGSAASDDGVARSVARAIRAFENGQNPEGFVDLARGY